MYVAPVFGKQAGGDALFFAQQGNGGDCLHATFPRPASRLAGIASDSVRGWLAFRPASGGAEEAAIQCGYAAGQVGAGS
ncbi:hypothetical protein D3C81_2222250 [compost metagenome]